MALKWAVISGVIRVEEKCFNGCFFKILNRYPDEIAKIFFKAVLTFYVKKNFIVFQVLFKTDKHELYGFLFHSVIQHDLDVTADILIKQVFNDLYLS